MLNPMKFKFLELPMMDGKPVAPKLQVKIPRDVENKKGWSKSRALKDAVKDAFAAAWKTGTRSFAETFIKVFKEEIDEYVDWNPDDILLKVRLPIRGLRWITLKKFKLSALERWVED